MLHEHQNHLGACEKDQCLLFPQPPWIWISRWAPIIPLYPALQVILLWLRVAVFKGLTILIPQLGLVCPRLSNASKPFFLSGEFCLIWMEIVLTGSEKTQPYCPPSIANGHWAWLSCQLVIFPFSQVSVPRFDQKHYSHRTEPEPAGGDHPFHHRDPDLGRSEWQLCIWVRVSDVFWFFFFWIFS